MIQVPFSLASPAALTLYQSIYILIDTDLMKNPPDPDSYLPLKPHWFHVLLSLADEDQHGYGIMQEVLDRTAGKVRLWPATLYGTLRRLMEEDLIEESGGDERRRYYRLTKLGRRVLGAECRRLEDLVSVIRSKRGVKPMEA